MKCIQLHSEDAKACQIFKTLMSAYMKEVDEHVNEQHTSEFMDKFINSIIAIQGEKDRHLELCYDENALIGFIYGKVDHEEHRGYKKSGYGYIMEFYVRPEYRRKGYGRAMFERLQTLFSNHGVSKMYLTADPVTGRPFWEAIGFEKTEEIMPDNGNNIFERKVDIK